MAKRTGKNYSNMMPPAGITTFEDCNFAWREPRKAGNKKRGVVIFPDNTPRTFIHCNLINCEIPDGSTTPLNANGLGCNRNIVEYDVVTDFETVRLDGENFKIEKLGHTIHARVIDGEYVDEPTPIEFAGRWPKG